MDEQKIIADMVAEGYLDAVYSQILEASIDVDQQFASITSEALSAFRTSFVVPASHPRSAAMKNYDYRVGSIEEAFTGGSALVMIDRAFQSLLWIIDALPADALVRWVTPNESETKERQWLDRFIVEQQLMEKKIDEVIAVGGGIITNASAYIAERIGCNLTYVPSSVLAMSDGSIGGKVRANAIDGDVYHKHAYKTFYEPNQVIIDPRFLESLPAKQISVGMGEIIKHGVYQSRLLLEYLTSDDFNPYHNKQALLKSVLWAAALKAVCLRIDPEETKDGSHIIMRGGHEASDKMEEVSKFIIPHGTAVALAIRAELADKQDPLLPLVDHCIRKFDIRA